MVVLVILLYLILGFYEIFPLMKKGENKKLWLFIPLFLGSFIISLLLSLNITPPSPANLIEQLVKAFVKNS